MIAIMLAGTSAMLLSLFGTRWLIVFFRQRGQGQPILGKDAPDDAYVDEPEKINVARYMVGEVGFDFRLREDGKIQVINSCRKKTLDGKLKQAKGKAKVVDEATNAKLRMTLTSIGRVVTDEPDGESK